MTDTERQELRGVQAALNAVGAPTHDGPDQGDAGPPIKLSLAGRVYALAAMNDRLARLGRAMEAERDALSEQVEGLTQAEHRVCEGCGSARSEASLKADGYVSCCPERKMLTAKEWSKRAFAAEAKLSALTRENEGLRESLFVARSGAAAFHQRIMDLVTVLRPFAHIGELLERFEAEYGKKSLNEYGEHFKAAYAALSPTADEPAKGEA